MLLNILSSLNFFTSFLTLHEMAFHISCRQEIDSHRIDLLFIPLLRPPSLNCASFLVLDFAFFTPLHYFFFSFYFCFFFHALKTRLVFPFPFTFVLFHYLWQHLFSLLFPRLALCSCHGFLIASVPIAIRCLSLIVCLKVFWLWRTPKAVFPHFFFSLK